MKGKGKKFPVRSSPHLPNENFLGKVRRWPSLHTKIKLSKFYTKRQKQSVIAYSCKKMCNSIVTHLTSLNQRDPLLALH